MFKNRKLEVRLVKDDVTPASVANDVENKAENVKIAEEAIVRLGKKLLVGAIVTIAAVALVEVLANAADTALQNSLVSD